MSQEILNILLSALGVLVTGLVGWAVTAITSFLNTKIKDKKLAMFLSKATEIVFDAVKSVYQTYVETLKAEGKFDKEAQLKAKEKAVEIIKTQFTEEMKEFIEANFGNVEAWINEKIEAVLYSLKH